MNSSRLIPRSNTTQSKIITSVINKFSLSSIQHSPKVNVFHNPLLIIHSRAFTTEHNIFKRMQNLKTEITRKFSQSSPSTNSSESNNHNHNNSSNPSSSSSPGPSPSSSSSSATPHKLPYTESNPAFQVVYNLPKDKQGTLITCEHASAHLPEPWSWSDRDRRLVGDHWSYDPGSKELTHELCHAVPSVALLSTVTRLLVDNNRPLSSDTLMRQTADHLPVDLNSPEKLNLERMDRLNKYYHPYHTMLQQLPLSYNFSLALSLHSYTAIYEGNPRLVQIGVLYNHDQDKPLAEEICSAFFAMMPTADVRLNEPWSGKGGYMHAVESVRSHCSNRSIMLEFRNDLLIQPKFRAQVVQALKPILEKLNTQTPSTP